MPDELVHFSKNAKHRIDDANHDGSTDLQDIDFALLEEQARASQSVIVVYSNM